MLSCERPQYQDQDQDQDQDQEQSERILEYELSKYRTSKRWYFRYSSCLQNRKFRH